MWRFGNDTAPGCVPVATMLVNCSTRFLRMNLKRSIGSLPLAFVIASLLVGVSVASQSNDFVLGPLLSHFPLTLDEGARTEALGPLFYQQQRDTEDTIAFPPFYSHVVDPVVESEEYDFLYPLLSYDRYGGEYRWHFFQLFSFAGGKNQEEIPARRFTLFPIYFQQRSSQPDLNYTALFPVYGHLKNRLFKDEIFFAGFPIYARTRKRDVVTDNYGYPFFHLRRGNALEGWQFWPLAGHEHKDVTTKTNGFGDIEVIGGHDRSFVLWPFYLKQNNGVGTPNPQVQLAVIPFYASLRSPNRDSTSIFWPFFTWTDDRERKYREWDFPWPLMVIARGEGKTTTRIWPLFSQSHNEFLESNFYLWPVYKYNRVHSGALDRDRTRILLYLFSKVNEKNLETGKARTRTDLWPLFTHRHELNGNTRFQMLAPIEPLLPHSKSVERNWSPLWSVWRSEQNPKAGTASRSLLWNLYRAETSATTRKNSLLFGLFQYHSDTESKRWRVFYLPLASVKKESGHVSEHR